MGAVDDGEVTQIAIDTGVDPTGAPIMILSGELDSSNAGSLEAAAAVITAEPPELLIFDVSGLRFIDSAGIAVLIGVARKVNAVRLRHPSAIVRRVVEITGLSEVLHIET
jgi:anti-sigma B factor antagonist